MKLAAWLTATCLAAAPLLAAAPPALDVEVPAGPFTVGDPVDVVLTLRGDGASLPDLRWPDWSKGWGDAVVLAADPPEPVSGATAPTVRQHLRIAGYRTGRIELPPVAIELGGARPRSLLTPDGLAFEIRSVLPPRTDPAELTPKPADPPRELPVPAAFWWTAGALAAAALAAAWALARRPKRAVGAPTLAPLAELERRLGEIGEGDAVAGHAALSLALRRYLGRTLAMPAAESSTSELARRLDDRRLDRELARRAIRLLREADPVKFARRPTSGEQLRQRLLEAREVGRAIELQIHPPTPPVEDHAA